MCLLASSVDWAQGIIHAQGCRVSCRCLAGVTLGCCYPTDKSNAAGYWGSYTDCDTAPWLLEALFQHLHENETVSSWWELWTLSSLFSEEIDRSCVSCLTEVKCFECALQFDVVYWTGDLPGHNVWDQTRQDQMHAQEFVNGLFLKYFPGKLILPAVGNHESAPVNRYAQILASHQTCTFVLCLCCGLPLMKRNCECECSLHQHCP